MPREAFHGRTGAGDYGDFVNQIDDTVGQVLKSIDDAGIRKNTLVLFASDNGAYWWPDDIERYGHRANNGWRGLKADIFDGGHRVPFLARWPGRVKAGSTCDDIACLTDVVGTAADLLSVKLPDDAAEDSFSLWGGMTGGKSRRKWVIHHSSEGMFSLRDGEWKFIDGRGSGGFSKPVTITPAPGEPAGELYDLAKDPAETRNLYTDQPDVVKRLKDLLERAKADGRTRPIAASAAS